MSHPETLKHLRDINGNAFASSAYRMIDGEAYIVGRFCRCCPKGDNWDVFVCNPLDMYQGLSQRKVRSIHRRIAEITSATGPFSELEGEGVYHAMPLDTLVRSAAVLGLKRKPVMTDKRRESLARANAARKEKAPAATEALKAESLRKETSDDYI